MKKFINTWLIILILFTTTSFAFAKKTKKEIKKKKSTVSSFLGFFKFKDTDAPKIEFEVGMLTYGTSNKYWDLLRIEPFVKMHWAVLDKYLQPYVLLSIDSSVLNYKISDSFIGSMPFSMNLKLKSSGNPSLGGGIKFFVLSWKGLTIKLFAQMQISSLNDAYPKEANINFNTTKFNISELIAEHINISYSIRRYDTGATFSYKFFNWFDLYTSLGYIYFDVAIKINMDDYIINTIRALTPAKLEMADLIPKRISMEVSNFLGLLGMKFKLYKRLYLRVEGTIVPYKDPIYFGLFSLTIQGAK